MRQLNGVYSQTSNRRHGRSGHVFQGRYKAILVEKESYLLELSRYVVLNPVRAKGMVRRVDDWSWSSYGARVGEVSKPDWLTVDWLLAQFGGSLKEARLAYQEFVEAGVGGSSIWSELNGQIYLGSEAFVEQMLSHVEVEKEDFNIPKTQKRPVAPTLDKLEKQSSGRNKAITLAYETGAYSQREIGKYFGLHPSTVGVIVRKSRVS